jgi:hypothetical protein
MGPRYPATTEGLRELIVDILEAAGRGDRAEAFALADGLRLEDPQAFFGGVFGAQLGDELAADYTAAAERIREIVPLLREVAAAGEAEVLVEAFEEPSERAVGYQSRALERMLVPTTLYSVRFARPDEGRGFHLWSFVHDGTSFRWAGKMQRATDDDVPPVEVQLGLPEGAEIPLDGDVPDLLELPAAANVRPGE